MQTISYVHIQQFQATFMSVFFWEAPFLVFTNCLQLIKAQLCEPMSHYLCYCIFYLVPNRECAVAFKQGATSAIGK